MRHYGAISIAIYTLQTSPISEVSIPMRLFDVDADMDQIFSSSHSGFHLGYARPGPHLPQEIIDSIIALLWDDPVSLGLCSLVCCAWLKTSIKYLEEYTGGVLKIRDWAALVACSRALKTYTRQSHFHTIQIIDDPKRPFSHLFPMLVPGCDLAGISILELGGVNWTTTRLSTHFFDFLAYFASIRTLGLRQCRFGSASDLRRMIIAFPQLEVLILDRVDFNDKFKSSFAVNAMVKTSQTLQTVHLSHCSGRSYRTSGPLCGSDCMGIHSIPSFYASHRNISTLRLQLEHFLSPTHLFHFVGYFHLRHLTVAGRPIAASSWQPLFTGHGPEAYLLPTRRMFSSLEVEHVPSICSLWLMSLLSAPRTQNRIESLIIRHSDCSDPVTFMALLHRIQRALESCGPVLKHFSLLSPCILGARILLPPF